MIGNYITVAWRNLIRHKGYSMINMTGLAVGLACCLLILLYIQQELSYDRYHENADRIYRVGFRQVVTQGRGMNTARTPHPLAPTLLASFPEVEAATRFRRAYNPLVRLGERGFVEERFYFADAQVFALFSFPLLQGDPTTALSQPFSVVLSEVMAQKYFAGADLIGQRLTVADVGDMEVTGVLRNIPANSHFTFDFLASYSTLQTTQSGQLQQWDMNVTSTYIMLPEGSSALRLEAKLPTLVDQYLGADASASFIINEAAAQQFGWDDAVGKTIDWDYGGKVGSVIGVVRDFHFQPLHQTIDPLLLHMDPSYFNHLLVRLAPGPLNTGLDRLAQVWDRFDSAYSLVYSFVDEDFDRHYRFEQKTTQLVT